jgi:hypothetical protein
MNPFVIVSVVVGLALALLLSVFWKRLMVPPHDPLYNMRCPSCKRKLHYRGSRAGKQAQCPKCKGRFAYPLSPPPEENRG